MNRRSFIAAGAAILAIGSNRAFGQAHAELISGTHAVSDLTGAKLNLGRTGFELLAKIHDDETGEEMITFKAGNCAANVRFVPAGTDTQAFLDRRAAAISDQLDVAEVVGSDVLDDGGWIAISSVNSDGENLATYIEFQVGAFADYDLEVYMSTSHDAVESDLELLKGVVLEGMELFLFTEESGIETLEFPTVSVGGSSRGSRGTGASESVRSGRGGDTTASTSEVDEDAVIEAVREHQVQFTDELDRFYDIVDQLGNEDATAADDAEWMTGLMDLMFAWMAYPDNASELSFPASLSNLESRYLEWTEGVGEMGTTMSNWMLGGGEIDDFITAIDVAVQLNTSLSAELRTLGVIIRPVGWGRSPIDLQLRTVDIRMQEIRVA